MINNYDESTSVESKIQQLRELEDKISILTCEIIRMGGDHRRPVIIYNSSQEKSNSTSTDNLSQLGNISVDNLTQK